MIDHTVCLVNVYLVSKMLTVAHYNVIHIVCLVQPSPKHKDIHVTVIETGEVANLINLMML